MRNIYVYDRNAAKCNHWGYRVLIVLFFALAVFSTSVAVRNSKPICTDLRATGNSEATRRLECVYDLGNIQEDEANVIIINE